MSPLRGRSSACRTGPSCGRLRGQIVARGYTRLVFVGPFEAFGPAINLYEIEERYAGFKEAIAGLPGVEGDLLPRADYVEQVRRIDLRAARTAVICASDIFALEIMTDLRGRGISVPAHIGLMGFDNIDALRFISPRLSTVEYPIQRMGEIAFSLLVEPPVGGDAIPFIELEPKILWGNRSRTVVRSSMDLPGFRGSKMPSTAFFTDMNDWRAASAWRRWNTVLSPFSAFLPPFAHRGCPGETIAKLLSLLFIQQLPLGHDAQGKRVFAGDHRGELLCGVHVRFDIKIGQARESSEPARALEPLLGMWHDDAEVEITRRVEVTPGERSKKDYSKRARLGYDPPDELLDFGAQYRFRCSGVHAGQCRPAAQASTSAPSFAVSPSAPTASWIE